MITIRKCELSDMNVLIKLFNAYRVFYKMDADIPMAEKFLAARIKNQDSVIFVSENEASQLTGFVQLYPLFSSTRMQRLWLLNDLFVDPDHRGKGISKMLIQEAKHLCIMSGSCGMMLETAKSNIIGNQLYPSAGFELDKNHNYYTWDC
jgi:GNAT superfamily N-acetyltransferase